MADVLRGALRAALAGFADADRPLHEAARALLGALGYDSERTAGRGGGEGRTPTPGSWPSWRQRGSCPTGSAR